MNAMSVFYLCYTVVRSIERLRKASQSRPAQCTVTLASIKWNESKD